MLLTIKARRKFCTLETASKLYFCQNKNESKLNELFFFFFFFFFFLLNLKEVFKGMVWMQNSMFYFILFLLSNYPHCDYADYAITKCCF